MVQGPFSPGTSAPRPLPPKSSFTIEFPEHLPECETERAKQTMVQHGTTEVSGEAILTKDMVIGPQPTEFCGQQWIEKR